ncbi:hypothetical protein [uncultured Imperialibacter sp.]|uniref:hypothetical protein n=1 Tax=uncultured Imperialibacter sp. TaxID=1672639 RepID=UPI0030D963B8|tara:strand:- start:53052 stop:54128 length:1077 start_codon:yes stop_codon:yes gene_type:complete
MLIRVKILLVVLSLLHLIASAQNSVLQDSEGKTSIFNQQENGVTFNFTDSKISYSRLKFISEEDAFFVNSDVKIWGVEGSMETSDGSSPILSEKEFMPQGEVSLFRNFRWIKINDEGTIPVVDDLYLKISANASRFNLLNDIDEIVETDHYGFGFGLGYNSIAGYKSKVKSIVKIETGEMDSTWVYKLIKGCACDSTLVLKPKVETREIWKMNTAMLGTVVEISSGNNLTSLDKETVFTSRSSGQNTFHSDEKTVFGPENDYEGNIPNLSLNSDYLYLPHKIDPIGIFLFNRFTYQPRGNKEFQNNSGIGIALVKEKDSRQIVGSLSLEVEDTFGINNSANDNFGKRLKMNLVVGYPF